MLIISPLLGVVKDGVLDDKLRFIGARGDAGALYGYDAIPKEWRDKLIKREYIEEMCRRAAENWTERE